MAELQAHDLVGPYELLEPAGAGGFSVVWKARRAGAEDPVALKVPRVGTLIEHLRREVALGRDLGDPQVAGVIDADLDHDPPYLVTPWVDGHDLKLPHVPPTPPRIVVALERVAALAEVVARLHRVGVVHGDLKPGNVRIRPDGRPVILDLGLARLQNATRRDRSLAQSLVSVDGHSIAGTLDYLAPEVLDGEDASAVSDVYALTVLLHHLLTGQPPAFGVDPAARNPYLPPGTVRLLRAGLAADPTRRLRGAGRLLEGVSALIRLERRCLRRRNGHQRRRVWQARMAVLRRGLRAVRPALLGLAVVLFFLVWLLAGGGSSIDLGDLPGIVAALAILAGLFFVWVPILLGMTTINAWLLGIPEREYKDRPGHSLWSFMMQ